LSITNWIYKLNILCIFCCSAKFGSKWHLINQCVYFAFRTIVIFEVLLLEKHVSTKKNFQIKYFNFFYFLYLQLPQYAICYSSHMIITKHMTYCDNYKWRTPKLLDGLNWKSKGENNGRRRNWACSLIRNISRDKRACWSSRMGLGWGQRANYSCGLAQTKQQVG
jgi:hypothetical protein